MLILLRNKRCSLAQQRGGWLRKAVGGAWVVSSKERSVHLLGEKCALLITLLAIVGGITIAEFCDS